MLDKDLTASLNILSRLSASVAAVMNSSNQDSNRFAQALQSLKKMSDEFDIPMAIVGGLAAIHFGYPAITEDIDLLVGSADLDRVLELAPRYGLQICWRAESGWHTLEHGDVEINIVPEGRRANDNAPTAIPGPKQLGVATGIDYASLPGWVELKIGSGRRKDLTHVVEVLKKTDKSKIDQIKDHLQAVDSEYFAKFNSLVTEAEHERQQEDQRGWRNR